MVDCVVILSGGMDSVTLLHYLVKREDRHPAVITFAYGQKHAREIEYAKWHVSVLGCDTHEIVDLAPLKDLWSISSLINHEMKMPDITDARIETQPSTYVPNRNMIFLALAVAYAENIDAHEVFYGAQRHELYGYWDTTPEFVIALNSVYSLNRETPAQIKAPFANLTKADILRVGLELDVDYGKTWSCYAGGELACGRCPTCVERLKAFQEIGISDPLLYVSRN